MATDGLATRSDVLRGLLFQQLPHVLKIGNFWTDIGYVIHPFFKIEDPLPPFLAVFVLRDTESTEGAPQPGNDAPLISASQFSGLDSVLLFRPGFFLFITDLFTFVRRLGHRLYHPVVFRAYRH